MANTSNSNRNQNDGGKSSRQSYTIKQKQQVCQYAEQHKVTQDQIAAHFSREWGMKVTRDWVSKILKEKHRFLNAQVELHGDKKRERKAQHVGLETALFEWFKQKRSQGASLTDAIVVDKAKKIAKELDISEEDFKASPGWLSNLKSRYKIKSYGLHGESGSADNLGIQLAKDAVPKIIEELKLTPDDIYNADETGLYYRGRPSKTLDHTGNVRGKKKILDRITMLLCCNLTGRHRLKILAIHKSAKPRCFGQWDPNTIVDYHNNSSAWMNAKIFEGWLRKFDAILRGQKRKAVLFCDNASSHDVAGAERVNMHGLEAIQLSNLSIVFLPANTTSVIQPLDQGIIAALKVGYKRRLLEWNIAEIEASPPGQDLSKLMPNVKDALIWANAAWRGLTDNTIRNCWRMSGILPITWQADISNQAEAQATMAMRRELDQLGALIDKLNPMKDLTL